MKIKTLRYCLEVFNGEKDKARRFLYRNFGRTDEEIKHELDILNYGGF